MCDLRTWLEPMGWLVLVVLGIAFVIAATVWLDGRLYRRKLQLDREDAGYRADAAAAFQRGREVGRMDRGAGRFVDAAGVALPDGGQK